MGPVVGIGQPSPAVEFSTDVVVPPYVPGSTVRLIISGQLQKTVTSLIQMGPASPAACSDFALPSSIRGPVVVTRSSPLDSNEPIQISVSRIFRPAPVTVRSRPILLRGEFEVIFDQHQRRARAIDRSIFRAGLAPTARSTLGSTFLTAPTGSEDACGWSLISLTLTIRFGPLSTFVDDRRPSELVATEVTKRPGSSPGRCRVQGSVEARRAAHSGPWRC